MIFIGVDPGAKGSLVALRGDKVLLMSIFNKHEYRRIVSYCVELNVTYAVVEQVHAMPSQGVTSMFSFGENYGWIKGLLDAFEVPFVTIPPQNWKKQYDLISPKGTDKKVIKQRSIECAKTLFPDTSLLASARCKVESDGLAEGLLIANFCRRNFDALFNY